MIRGTTPALTLTVPVDLTGQQCELTIRQGQTRVVLTGDRLTVSAGENSVIACRLTQVETLGFAAGEPVLVQLRWISADGIASATYTTKLSVLEIQRNGVIAYE